MVKSLIKAAREGEHIYSIILKNYKKISPSQLGDWVVEKAIKIKNQSQKYQLHI